MYSDTKEIDSISKAVCSSIYKWLILIEKEAKCADSINSVQPGQSAQADLGHTFC